MMLGHVYVVDALLVCTVGRIESGCVTVRCVDRDPTRVGAVVAVGWHCGACKASAPDCFMMPLPMTVGMHASAKHNASA